MRDQLAKAFEHAMAGDDKRRASVMRQIAAAVCDRDATARAGGGDRMCEAQISRLLCQMVREREVAARAFESAGKSARAAEERADMAVIAELLPAPVVDGERAAACLEAPAAKPQRAVGRVMTALRNRYGGRMNLSDTRVVVRDLLR